MILYHGTCERNLEGIQEYGLISSDYKEYVTNWLWKRKQTPRPVSQFFDFSKAHEGFSEQEEKVHALFKSNADVLDKVSLTANTMVASTYAAEAAKEGSGVLEGKLFSILKEDADIYNRTPSKPIVLVCEIPVETNDLVVMVDEVKLEQILEVVFLEVEDVNS